MTLSPGKLRAVVTASLLGIFLSALEQAVVATALPKMALSLGGFDQISWVVTAYLLSSTCSTLILGKLSDIYGRRRMFYFVIITFIVGSVLCAISSTMLAIIVSRAIQGVGGGGQLVLAQATMADFVTPRERGKYAGYFSLVWATAGLMGPTVGGILSEHANWRAIFWMNLPLGLLVLAMVVYALHDLKQEYQKVPIDYLGMLFLILATIPILIFLSSGNVEFAWMSYQSFILILFSICGVILFIQRQRFVLDPIVPTHFLTNPVVGPVLAAAFILNGTFIAISVLSPLYFQIALGLSASQAGLHMIPVLTSTSAASGIGGWLTRRTGRYKLIGISGLPITIISLTLIGIYASTASALLISMLLGMTGFGIGAIFPSTTVAAQNAVERRDLGAVSGATTFARALGGALILAVCTAALLQMIAASLEDLGGTATLEALASHALPRDERVIIAGRFGYLFIGLSLLTALGMALFFRIEDRALSSSSSGPTSPPAAHA